MREKEREVPEQNPRPEQPTPEEAAQQEPQQPQPASGKTEDQTTQKLAEASLREQLEAAIAERDANYDRWMRARAELENFRKRTEREAEELRKYQAFQLIRDLLPALDNLERAIEAAEAESSGSPEQRLTQLTEGLRMVHRQFLEILARYGAKPIDALNKTFDPNYHEAVSQVATDEHPPMTVVQEVERGYMVHDRVVRPTKVVVAKAPEPAEGEQGSGQPGQSSPGEEQPDTPDN